MSTSASPPAEPSNPVKTVIQHLIGVGILLALVFLPAGHIGWVRGWIYVGLLQAGWWINYLLLMRSNPDLVQRREKAGAGTPKWDEALQHFVRLSVIAVFVVAGLDGGRHGWCLLGGWSLVVGAALHVLGYVVLIWAMLTNAHFEGFVRIQDDGVDGGHRVVSDGPYAIVRHPGYVGFSLILLAIPFVLGSGWGLLPAGITVGLLVVRTALEDRFLQESLSGYGDYAKRVRKRLVPFVW